MKNNLVSIAVADVAHFPKNFAFIDDQISACIPARTTIEPITIGQTALGFDFKPICATTAVHAFLGDFAIVIYLCSVLATVCTISPLDHNKSLPIKTITIPLIIMYTMHMIGTIDGFCLWASADLRDTANVPAHPHIAIVFIGAIVE